ncbi:hypothetical protein B0H14DRAFT_2631503 [Mycena olivaceomarginata]|nr:hypothetical protein B0H14DRAFT_2631503 [Mycena olivaceomarginata]
MHWTFGALGLRPLHSFLPQSLHALAHSRTSFAPPQSGAGRTYGKTAFVVLLEALVLSHVRLRRHGASRAPAATRPAIAELVTPRAGGLRHCDWSQPPATNSVAATIDADEVPLERPLVDLGVVFTAAVGSADIPLGTL